VSIPNTDTNFCTNCWIYIGVYGYTATTFSVVAHYGGSTSLQVSVILFSNYHRLSIEASVLVHRTAFLNLVMSNVRKWSTIPLLHGAGMMSLL
jgi:hypothetical protein